MKYIKYSLLSLSLALVGVSCTGDYEDINRNPNQIIVGEVQPCNVIEPILIKGSNDMMSDLYSYANEIAQVTVASASNVREEHRYNLANSQFVGVWNDCYRWATQADHMYQLAVAQGDVNYQAIGLTLKVYFLQICTDMFGGIAYSEALKIDQNILQPRVETQQEVYQNMMADLERANGLYNEKQALVQSAKDRMYAGNITKWRKFTNSLHLRLLMRVSGRNTAFTPSVGDRINAIVNNPQQYPIFASNADNAAVQFPGGETYYRNIFNRTDYKSENSFSGEHHLSSQFLALTLFSADGSKHDPRLHIWGKPRPGNKYKWLGAISGCTKATGAKFKDQEALMHYETLVRDTNPNHLMSYDEVLFILSEAAFNGWIAASAEEYYKAAVRASCEKWNDYGKYAAYPVIVDEKSTETTTVTITPADIDAFLAMPEIAYDGTLKRIAEQKWVSLFWVAGFEMYSEMRRTGYPECTIGKGAVDYNYTQGKFPARWGYPQIALANNRAHYIAALQAMGGAGVEDNTMLLPVWWSGQAVARDAGQPWEHSFRKLIQGDK